MSAAESPAPGAAGEVVFVRLTEASPAAVRALLNEPRNARHLPLNRAFDDAAAAAWVRAKDAQWQEHGYGPWAVLIDGRLAGWGGFQREENGADLALVLAPGHWGRGAAIARALLARGFDELGLDVVLIALPLSRNPGRVVARLGFVPDGEVTYDEVRFRQYRLDRATWTAGATGSANA